MNRHRQFREDDGHDGCRSHTGKIDRKALPIPSKERPKSSKKFEAPKNHEEKILAEVWSEILDMERVGIHDNFFELGGHSLLATQVISKIKEIAQLPSDITNNSFMRN